MYHDLQSLPYRKAFMSCSLSHIAHMPAMRYRQKVTSNSIDTNATTCSKPQRQYADNVPMAHIVKNINHTLVPMEYVRIEMEMRFSTLKAV